MSALGFDPYAHLAKQQTPPAKVAKDANEGLTLASLATLAAPVPKTKNIGDWSAIDWQAFYNERAGIAEYDGTLSRADAESMAYEHCVVRWLNDNPSDHADASICAHCKKLTDDKSIAVLNSKGGHLWIHEKCHPIWRAFRKSDARKALALFGIRHNKGEG